jgi:transcriptional regulator with XRE-family HTH domain
MTSGRANGRGSGGRPARDGDEALRLRDRREKSGQEVLKKIGAHLRAARVERKLTLEQVASGAGLTKGFLSQLERGESSASIASLLALCSVLDLSVAALLDQAAGPITLDPVIRRADRTMMYLGGEGVTDYLVSPPRDRRFEVFETHLEPLGCPSEQQYTLEAEVGFAYVVQGRLEFRLGSACHILQAGDTVTYSPRDDHTFRNPSATRKAVVIFVNSPAVF